MDFQTVLLMLGGRFWEESNNDRNSMQNKPTQLPTGDGGVWWSRAVASGYYQTGQTPELGAVICFYDSNGGAGHVAIVEEIHTDGSITCSNSAWQSTYFFTTNITPVNGKYNWSHFVFQGFIYNPFIDISNKKNYKWFMRNKNIILYK